MADESQGHAKVPRLTPPPILGLSGREGHQYPRDRPAAHARLLLPRCPPGVEPDNPGYRDYMPNGRHRGSLRMTKRAGAVKHCIYLPWEKSHDDLPGVFNAQRRAQRAVGQRARREGNLYARRFSARCGQG